MREGGKKEQDEMERRRESRHNRKMDSQGKSNCVADFYEDGDNDSREVCREGWK